jgi:arylsulfatase A-like enzyme
MTRANQHRVLIVVFDALRPEFVTPELTPNLHRFASEGIRYANSRSTFPTETRVNQSAVITGCYPSRHGIVANKFVLNDGGEPRTVNTGDDLELEPVFEQLSGRLLDVPTLGERLASKDLTYATISAGTPGGGRLINHAAEAHGTFRLALRRTDAAAPAGVMPKITQRIGPLPDYSLPALKWNSYAVDCYLDYVEREINPDVMLLWLCEPDESFHKLGIGSSDALRAIAHVDAEFGRILTRQETQIADETLQIIALSDHGQISLSGVRLNLANRLADAGFNDCTIVAGNAGGIWVKDSDPKLITDITCWLREQDWCGPLFTRDGAAGTLTHDHVAIAHRRAPDIALVMSYSSDNNEWGLPGMTLHDAPYPTGGGCHGGLSPFELHNFLALSGSAFGQGKTITLPAGNIDITPTVLDLLGLEAPAGIDGRVLREAFRNGSTDAAMPAASEHTYSSTNSTGPITHLSVTQVSLPQAGATRYFNKAWVA